jgi:signal transduction histidine kinase
MRRRSLQSLLIALAVAVTLLAWTTGAAVVWMVAEQHTQELHDQQLRHMAHLLLGLSGHEIDEMGPDTPMAARIANGQADARETLGDDYRYQLWTTSGRLLLTNFGMPSPSAMAPLGSTGYTWLHMDGGRWRVYASIDVDASKVMQVAEREERRDWVANSFHGTWAAWVALSMGLVIWPTVMLVRRLLRPLRDIASQLSQRSPSRLESVQVPDAPTELAPILRAINGLFARMAEALQRERNFTALAAHELRTPLAALRLQAQVADSTTDSEVRSRNLRDLVHSADRCAHLQEQLLTLARLDTAQSGDMSESIDLTEVIMEATAEIAVSARRKHVRISTHGDGSAIRGHAFGVRTLVRNLVSNAVRHAHEGGRVEIGIEGRSTTATLRIDDSGPGIPPELRERAFERFERLNSTANDGVGLGLSIVRAVADSHAAEITLGESNLGGLSVLVAFAGRRIDSLDPSEACASEALEVDGGP